MAPVTRVLRGTIASAVKPMVSSQCALLSHPLCKHTVNRGAGTDVLHLIAFKPSPEAGTWNQAYFEALVKNAKPSFA